MTWGPLGQRRRPDDRSEEKSWLRCSQPCQHQQFSRPPNDRSDGLPCPLAIKLAQSGFVTAAREALCQSSAPCRNEPTLGEQDHRETGANHRFCRLAAAAMVDGDWTDRNRNNISLPENDQDDASSPADVKYRLFGLNLTICAANLPRAVPILEAP